MKKFQLISLLFATCIIPGSHVKSCNYPDSFDAIIAAPDSHKVLLENDSVRVLRVVIEPGVREPFHTHRFNSVMIVDQPAQIKYYGKDGQLVFITKSTDGKSHQKPKWLVSEGLHSVENIDNRVYKAYRIEIKE